MKDFVDVISWDSYPTWHSDRGDFYEGHTIAFAHDLHRGLKRKPFLLMESTPSLTNWLPYNKLKKPGMHRLSSLQAVAHGSDSVQYFQWRKGRGGNEKFHGAVIDHNNKPEGRVFDDVKNLGITLEKIKEIAGTETKSQVALVYEFRNRWAIDNSSGFNNADKKYKRPCINHYLQFWKRGINVDVIGADYDLSDYKVVVLPMLYSLSEKQIGNIEKFVANGGTVVATYMTGYANETDLCYMGGFPGGKLKDVFGLCADEIDTLYETDFNFVKLNNKSFKVVDYCELITPFSAEVTGKYEMDFYKG
jgi:beta-galactosidase